MSRQRQPGLLSAPVWAMAFGILLLAGTLGRAWALPGRVPLGQTIPPLPTATPTDTVSAQLTATWTPRPTWTRVATQLPELPTATATPAVSLPTATQPAIPALTPTLLGPTATRGALAPTLTATLAPAIATPTREVPPATPSPHLPGTPSSPLPTAGSPSAPLLPTTPSAQPIPLAFEVAVLPQVAGPADVVQFILQVANVGYEPVDDVQVQVVFPVDLQLQFVECPRCTTDCPQCKGGPMPKRLTIFIGRLLSGEQVLAPVHVEVVDDAWPGQTQRTAWTLTATGLPAQTAQADVVLPWAQLPATGGE